MATREATTGLQPACSSYKFERSASVPVAGRSPLQVRLEILVTALGSEGTDVEANQSESQILLWLVVAAFLGAMFGAYLAAYAAVVVYDALMG